ncbi:RNA polymerase sigma factor [Yinghuangia seranimata]|uniref:RNA polymerase sigma factor n=1 Tax=Yinghuangia seranimata TaxID=408067 RepID=UPI00248C2F89|nr:hypothetical protein [Yinghuangia seranimata]MDI2129867.1 hypothetical protein [Yinghuangia seranimata]
MLREYSTEWGARTAARARALSGRLPGYHEVRAGEAVLVRRYPELVRAAYFILPAADERHDRVLAAHSVVQDALPRRWRGSAPPDEDTVRARVVKLALRRLERSWRVRSLPQVWGLRFVTLASGPEAVAVEKAVDALGPEARAAYVLRFLAGLPVEAAHAVLAAAGVAEPGPALADAARVDAELVRAGHSARELLDSGPLDPCTVRVRPSDLLRRRRRRWSAGLAAGLLVATALVGLPGDGPSASGTGDRVRPAAAARPGAPIHVAADAWATTTRLDFAVWNTRGPLADDTALVERAVRAWSFSDPTVQVSAAARTQAGPPVGTQHLLYAGEFPGGLKVVILADATRIARYAEIGSARGLDLSAADDSDERSASAIVLTRGADGTRLLLAPWVTEARVRDLRRPAEAPRPVAVTGGVTAPVVLGGAECTRVPVLELRAKRAADGNPYLLADLGELTATHLTYMPPPEFPHTGRPAEAPSSDRALAAWARTACVLPDLRGKGLRLVNNWEYAHFALPETQGEATWSCLHGFDRTGGGQVVIEFNPPGADAAGARTVASLRDSPLCSRSANDVLAYTWWQSGSGAWYLVAAGSRDVAKVTATGPVTGNADARQLVVKSTAAAARGPAPNLTATVKGGTVIKPAN